MTLCKRCWKWGDSTSKFPARIRMRIPDIIRASLKTRLEIQAPYMSNWQQGMGLGAQPTQVLETINDILMMIDEVWHIAGDKSSDTNWYTKRMLLAGVYTSTELFMLMDKSPGYSDTWKFLDRRLEDAVALGGVPDQIERYVSGGVKFAFRAVSEALVFGGRSTGR
eukprot:399367_1